MVECRPIQNYHAVGTEAPMMRDEIVRFFETRQAAWRARSPDALADGHAAAGTVVSPMFGKLNGRAEIADAYCKLFATFPDWTYKNEELIVDGERVAQHFIATATMSANSWVFLARTVTVASRACDCSG